METIEKKEAVFSGLELEVVKTLFKAIVRMSEAHEMPQNDCRLRISFGFGDKLAIFIMKKGVTITETELKDVLGYGNSLTDKILLATISKKLKKAMKSFISESNDSSIQLIIRLSDIFVANQKEMLLPQGNLYSNGKPFYRTEVDDNGEEFGYRVELNEIL